MLPLDASKIKTIAVIGPDAWPAIVGGGGSSEALPFAAVSTVTGIANLLGPDVRVLYSRGLPEMVEVFRKTAWAGEVKVEAFPSHDFKGTPTTGTRRNVADWKPAEWEPADPNPRGIRYTASYKAGDAGKYLLIGAASGEDAFNISVDGKPMLDQAHAEGQVPKYATH